LCLFDIYDMVKIGRILQINFLLFMNDDTNTQNTGSETTENPTTEATPTEAQQ